MTRHTEAILNAADNLAAGRGLDYRGRLQLERAVFRLTAENAMRDLGRPLQSMSSDARDEILRYSKGSDLPPERLAAIELGFTAMRLISSIANVDPYVLNENISRIVHRYSTGVATLPLVLREFVAAQEV